MRKGRELGKNAGGNVRKQSSPDHQSKAALLGREEDACLEWRLKDLNQSSSAGTGRSKWARKQWLNNLLAVTRAREGDDSIARAIL